jgi:hypothetical protein
MLICLSFSSCENVFLSVENLMRPPKLSGEDSVLQAAFESSVSEYEGIVMKTPFSGNYRSSYVLFDIDNDEKEEAFVLYSVPAKSNFFIAKIFEFFDGEWFNTTQIHGNSSEIYEINFADINGDGCNEILLSSIISPDDEEIINSNFNLSYKLEIYSYDGDKTNLIVTESYTNIFFEDFNNNNADEILIFKVNFSDIKNLTTVRLLSFNKDYSVSYDKVTNISAMPKINSIVSDRIVLNGKNKSRVFVDGAFNESEIYTEIIEINESNFDISLPIHNENTTVIPSTLRIGKVYCMDVDGDGYIEVPTMEIFPFSKKINEENNEPLNLVVWSEYVNHSFNVKYKTFMNSKVGQLAIIPEEFIGKITVIYDEENLNLTFYSVNSDGKIENALFSFRVFTIPDWEENSFNYEKLSQNDTYVYGYLIFKADNYITYKKFITENFYAL